MARSYYIQNINTDPEPTGKFYELEMIGIPAPFKIWKAYHNEEPTAQQQGIDENAFKAWQKINRNRD